MIKLVVTLKTRIKETSNVFLPDCIKLSLNSSKNKKMCYFRGSRFYFKIVFFKINQVNPMIKLVVTSKLIIK